MSVATMVLWVDDHRPKGLDNLDLHPDVTRRLKKLVRSSADRIVLCYIALFIPRYTLIVSSALLHFSHSPRTLHSALCLVYFSM